MMSTISSTVVRTAGTKKREDAGVAAVHSPLPRVAEDLDVARRRPAADHLALDLGRQVEPHLQHGRLQDRDRGVGIQLADHLTPGVGLRVQRGLRIGARADHAPHRAAQGRAIGRLLAHPDAGIGRPTFERVAGRVGRAHPEPGLFQQPGIACRVRRDDVALAIEDGHGRALAQRPGRRAAQVSLLAQRQPPIVVPGGQAQRPEHGPGKEQGQEEE
jgi:hypothetical protein